MKKTLIALALTALPVAAMAEVTLYGNIRAGYEGSSTKYDNGSITDTYHNTGLLVPSRPSTNPTLNYINPRKSRDLSHPFVNGIADYGSYIGVKGNEDLGNGLKAIWQIESSVDLAGAGPSGKNTFSTRDSFIGLQSNYGTVKAGYLSNYINANMDDVDAWEYNNDAEQDALGLAKFTRTDARYYGVGYESPEWAGFSFSLLYSPRDNNNDGGNGSEKGRFAEYKNGIGDGAKYSLGLSYKNSGFYAKYGMDYLKNSAAKYSILYDFGGVGKATHEMKDGQVHRLEGGYDANNLFVGAGFQFTKNVPSYSRLANAASDTVATGAQFIANNQLWKVTSGGISNVLLHDVGMDNSGKEAALTLGYHFGNLFPKITYAHGWNVKVNGSTVDNTKYDQIVLGADYSFSKRTTANVQAGWLQEGLGRYHYSDGVIDTRVDQGKAKTASFGVGLKHVF